MAEMVCKVRRLNSVVSAKLVREITQNPRPGDPLQVSIISMGKKYWICVDWQTGRLDCGDTLLIHVGILLLEMQATPFLGELKTSMFW